MSLNFGPTVNAQLVALAGLNSETVDSSTFEIVTIDPLNPTTVVRCTTTATIPTANLIGALIAYFSPPNSTSASAAVTIHGDGTVTAAQFAAANTWVALTNAGVELAAGVRYSIVWLVNGTTATATVTLQAATGTTVDGVGFFNTDTGDTATRIVAVATQPFPTGGIYTAALTFNET